MGFGEVFKKSWKEYKLNFKAIFSSMFVLYVIPAIILMILGIWLLFSSGTVAQLTDIANTIDIKNNASSITEFSKLSNPNISAGGSLLFIILSIISALVGYLCFIGIISSSLKKEKFSFKDVIRNGKENYFRSIGYSVVTLIFLVLLFACLIIPGIIFLVYWVFGMFVLFNEKKGIIESLRTSFRIVRKRWWRTLGNMILLTLVSILISFVIGIPSMIVQAVQILQIVAGQFNVSFFVFASVFKQVTSIITTLITAPLTILFIKNLYLEMKKSVVSKK